MTAVYSSLHKIDLVAEAPDGTRHLVQTDHRSPAEIDDEPELSVLFALARIIVPQRSEQAKPDASGRRAVVRYVALGGLHPAIARVVASTDAQVEVDRRNVDLSAVERRPPAELADEAFAGLARRVLAREGLDATEEGLARFERIAAGAPTPDEDEIGYWTMVAELAAVTGEVLRASTGGHWVDDEQAYADIPFLFRAGGGELSVNAVGKAIKFLAHGDAESPRQLMRALEDRDTPEGPLLFTLKPADWGARDQMVWEPLADVAASGADVPLLVYGHDQPNTFAMFQRGDKHHDLVAMRAEAIRNLAAIELTVEEIVLSSVTFWVGHGDYFAAEKVLDPAFMAQMHGRIGELLAVAVPEKGRLFMTSAVASADAMAAFLAVVRGVHDKNEGGRALSPTVFLVSGGAIVGVARATEPEAEPAKKKGWLGRLLN